MPIQRSSPATRTRIARRAASSSSGPPVLSTIAFQHYESPAQARHPLPPPQNPRQSTKDAQFYFQSTALLARCSLPEQQPAPAKHKAPGPVSACMFCDGSATDQNTPAAPPSPTVASNFAASHPQPPPASSRPGSAGVFQDWQ